MQAATLLGGGLKAGAYLTWVAPCKEEEEGAMAESSCVHVGNTGKGHVADAGGILDSASSHGGAPLMGSTDH